MVTFGLLVGFERIDARLILRPTKFIPALTQTATSATKHKIYNNRRIFQQLETQRYISSSFCIV